MPTAVLDIDLAEPLPGIKGFENYDRALVLIRFKRCPVGRAQVFLDKGRIEAMKLRDALIRSAGSALRERVTHDYIKWDSVRFSGSNTPPVTVAICTRDRTEDLRRCLAALEKLDYRDYEVLVIDNCPHTESTRDLVRMLDKVRYVREEKPGLNRARNRALYEARNEIVAFTDDDAAPDPEWLSSLIRNFDHPLVLCVTGLTMPLELETEAQELFEKYCPFGRGFRRRVYTNRVVSPLAAARVGAGANMAVRRSLLEKVGPFDVSLDAGTRTHSGGDTDIFSRILSAGYHIVYDPAAVSWHRHRRSREELTKTLYGYGVGTYAFWTRHLMDGRPGVIRIAAKWFFSHQVRSLILSLLKSRGSMPSDLLFAELRGALAGPLSFIRSRRESRVVDGK